MKQEELIIKAKQYCENKGYIILEQKKDCLVILDRLMSRKLLPYFVFEIKPAKEEK